MARKARQRLASLQVRGFRMRVMPFFGLRASFKDSLSLPSGEKGGRVNASESLSSEESELMDWLSATQCAEPGVQSMN